MHSASLHSMTPSVPSDPSPLVRVIGVLTAVWCVGFAVVNVVFELTGRFHDGPHADYAAGITVMNWLVVGLKLLGAAIALRSIADRSRWPSPSALAVLLWGAFATIGLYAAGSVAQWIGMAFGLISHEGKLGATEVAYVLLFIVAAVGFGVLAISYSHRLRIRKSYAIIGTLGAPLMLLLVLVIAPAVLVALGVMPAIE